MDRARQWARDHEFQDRNTASDRAVELAPISPLDAAAPSVRAFSPEPEEEPMPEIPPVAQSHQRAEHQHHRPQKSDSTSPPGHKRSGSSARPHHQQSKSSLTQPQHKRSASTLAQPHHKSSESSLAPAQHAGATRHPRPQPSQSSIRFHDSERPSESRRQDSQSRSVPPPYHRRQASAANAASQSDDFSSRDASSLTLRPVPSSTYHEHRQRMQTNLGNIDDAPVEVRHTHDYFFRRPRPLMVEHRGHVLSVGESDKLDIEHPENSYDLDVRLKKQNHEHHPDSLHKQRERLDIFVDLIWVGIIANIAEHFHEQVFSYNVSSGRATGEFILLFVPAWRIWISLQAWLNSYYTDDYLQRFFVVWILILGIIWGNNAPYLLSDLQLEQDNWTIITYLVAMASFGVMQGIYAHWLPWLRRYILISWIVSIPGIGLWISSTVVDPGALKYGLVGGAVGYNAIEFIFLSTPWADRLLGNSIRRAQDARTMIRRYENFFIIALGEGIFLLIRGSPLVSPTAGFLNVHLGRGIMVLLLFYLFNWVYFHGDMSKRYIHAMDRRWWIKFLWQMLHVPLFAALVILSSGTLFLTMFPLPNEDSNNVYDYPANNIYECSYSNGTEAHYKRGIDAINLIKRAASPSQIYDDSTLRTATITTSVCVSVTLFCQLILALLNRPVDEKGTLRVSNPYVRMLPRAAGALVTALFWLAPNMDPTTILGALVGIVLAVAVLEQLLGMPTNAKIFEPKEAGVRRVLSSQYERRGSSQTNV